jgi:hypothetical protein
MGSLEDEGLDAFLDEHVAAQIGVQVDGVY